MKTTFDGQELYALETNVNKLVVKDDYWKSCEWNFDNEGCPHLCVYPTLYEAEQKLLELKKADLLSKSDFRIVKFSRS